MLPETLKILAIGNSFSVDALEWFYPLAQDLGIQNVVLGNLYIGSCTIRQHLENAEANMPNYDYYKNETGQWCSQAESSILAALQDEAWDIITLQQASGGSGLAETLTQDARLQKLINYVQENKTNPKTKLAWHMTWAYDQTSDHPHFANYQWDQQTMYQGIVKVVQDEVVHLPEIDFIIPTGTAIQNLRTSSLHDRITRDGFHLHLHVGRYLAALTWLQSLTSASISELSWVPDQNEISPADLLVIKQAATAALRQPFQITNLA